MAHTGRSHRFTATPAGCLDDFTRTDHRAARASLGMQAAVQKFPPLVREFKDIVTLQGPCRLCCCHECDSPWPTPVQQFLDHVRMPWIPSDRFSCHVVLCTSICSLLVVRCTSHAEASKQLVLEHRCQPCQPCQIMPGDPVDLRNSHANKGRKLSAPNNRALFGLSKAQHLNTRSPQNVGSSGFP